MVIVDGTCLYEVVTDSPRSVAAMERIGDETCAAPHVIDVEVASVLRRDAMRGVRDETAARQALDKLSRWPGERFGHQLFLPRVWELRHNVRGWDGFYVALAEVLDATLLTLDRRLAGATGPRCPIEVIGTAA